MEEGTKKGKRKELKQREQWRGERKIQKQRNYLFALRSSNKVTMSIYLLTLKYLLLVYLQQNNTLSVPQ
jgi:hypothetical protein